jgi:hypothetical protein
LVLFTDDQFQQMHDESVIMRLMIRLNNTLKSGTRFLTYAVVEDGAECFTWNIVEPTDQTFSHIRWVPASSHPLDVGRLDDVLSGNGGCVLLPLAMDVASTVHGSIEIHRHGVKISGAELGILEMR